MYRLHVIPFFEDYWQSRNASEPQAFIDPVRMDDALRRTQHLDLATRPKAVLTVVARELVLS